MVALGKAWVAARTAAQGARKQEAGQTLIEFALVLMMLLLLTFGMIDLSRAVYTASVLQAAAQAGARAGMVSLAGVDAAAKARLVGLDSARVEVTTAMLTSERLEVQVTYELDLMTPLIAQLVPQGRITLASSASMLTR